MSRGELELPVVSASTIARLRIPDNLEELHATAESSVPPYNRLYTVVSVIMRQHVTLEADKEAIDTGAKIAESVNFLQRRHNGGDFNESAVRFAADEFTRRLIDESYAEANVQRAVGKMDDTGFETFQTYERIALPYVGGDEDRLELAMRGAAVLHCAINDVTIIETNITPIRQPLKLV